MASPVIVWCGNYRFGRDDSFFPSVVTVARKYADKEPGVRPPAVHFHEALERLRDIAPPDGHVLIDQLEHRWDHPSCPPALYVLACTLRAPDQGALVAGSGRSVRRLACTKVGEAQRTVAARIAAYKKEVLGGVPIVERSQSLRVVIYGDGSMMPLEREIQEVARSLGRRAQKVVDGLGVRPVGGETYAGGIEMIDAICAFARQKL
jgi:hypothetical protein